MKNDSIKKYVSIALIVLLTVFLGGFIVLLLFYTDNLMNAAGKLLAIPQPFIYGAIIAYLIHPISSFFERMLKMLEYKVCKKEHPALLRMCSVFLAFVLALLVILLLLFAVIPQLAKTISGIAALIPKAVTDFQAWINTLETGEISHEVIAFIEELTNTISDRLQKFLSTDLLPNMQAILTEVTSSFFNLVDFLKNFGIGCIVAIYVLCSLEKFQAQGKLVLHSIFSQKWADRLLGEIHYADRMFSGFITGKLLDSFIIGILCFLFCVIVRMPYALLVSIIVGITNMIPFFGPYLGAIPSALLILMVSPAKCLVFLIFIIVLQQIDGNVIGPRILGDKMGVSGFWVLFSILFFGSLWGLPGMLVGVPVFAVIYDLLRKAILWGLHRRGKENLLTEYQQKFVHEPAASHSKARLSPRKKSVSK